MKKPYLRKFSKISKFTVWIVDGKFIRDNINIEFTNYAQNYMFDFIPKNEFWIDDASTKGEEKFYMNSMLRMNQLMANGISHQVACKIADDLEKRERMQALAEKMDIPIKEVEKLGRKVHLKLVEQSGPLKIWIVDGNIIRTLFFADFQEGGNDKVYSFVPRNEIWIDDALKKKERKFILLHELHERRLMTEGMRYDYLPWEEASEDTAHQNASRLESYYRKHPKEVDQAIKEEIEKISTKTVREIVPVQNIFPIGMKNLS